MGAVSSISLYSLPRQDDLRFNQMYFLTIRQFEIPIRRDEYILTEATKHVASFQVVGHADILKDCLTVLSC